MSTEDGLFCLTFNGEIYNFHEVRDELLAKGSQFRSRSDTEVILEAWRSWGFEAVRHFRGMFAFAIWDKREQQLWLVRDRIGEKPLYYFHGGHFFLFASEVRALLASGAVPRQVDSDGLDAYLTFGGVADPYTLVRNVRAVEAGHALLVRPAGVRSRSYWSLRDIPESDPCATRERVVSNVARVLRDSVQLTSVSDVPVAALLSGGIDSSSNVVLLSERDCTNLQTFSVTFDGPDASMSEEKWSSLVATKYGTQHTRFAVTEAEAREWIPQAVAAMDQPSWDGVNTYLVCKAISSAGVKVAISGQGADELFLGYHQRNLFRALLLAAKLPLRLLSPLIRYATRMLPAADSGYDKVLQLLGTDHALGAAYLSQHSIFSQASLEKLRGSRRPPQTRFIRDLGGATALGKLSRLQLGHYLKNTLLRDGDQMSMAHSIELRAPYVDYRLVEVVSSLPAPFRVIPTNRQKPLLVDAVGPGLPSDVANRPKQGFGLPYDRWLRTGLNIADLETAETGLCRSQVNQVIQRFKRGGHYSRFWCLQVLAAFVRLHRLSIPTKIS